MPSQLYRPTGFSTARSPHLYRPPGDDRLLYLSLSDLIRQSRWHQHVRKGHGTPCPYPDNQKEPHSIRQSRVKGPGRLYGMTGGYDLVIPGSRSPLQSFSNLIHRLFNCPHPASISAPRDTLSIVLTPPAINLF